MDGGVPADFRHAPVDALLDAHPAARHLAGIETGPPVADYDGAAAAGGAGRHLGGAAGNVFGDVAHRLPGGLGDVAGHLGRQAGLVLDAQRDGAADIGDGLFQRGQQGRGLQVQVGGAQPRPRLLAQPQHLLAGDLPATARDLLEQVQQGVVDAADVLPAGALQQPGPMLHAPAAGVVGDAVLQVLQLCLHGAVGQRHDADRDEGETDVEHLLSPVEARHQRDHRYETTDGHEDPGGVAVASSKQQVDQNRPDPQVGVPHHRVPTEPHPGAGEPEPDGVDQCDGPGQRQIQESADRGEQMGQGYQGQPENGGAGQARGKHVLEGGEALQDRGQAHAETHQSAHSSGWFLELHRWHFPTGTPDGRNPKISPTPRLEFVVSKLWSAPKAPE